MDRRQFLRRTSLMAAGAALPFQNLMARTSDNFTSLRRNVGYFTERGGTIGWLASPDAMVVIDSQFPQTAKNCLNGLKDRTDHPLDLLINTHHHGDHTAGNPVFEGVAEKMVAHENVPELMKQDAEESDGEQEIAYPSTTFAENWQTDVGDETVHVNYYGPGHTSGDSIIYFEKANVVHMGDLVFNRMNPYTDRPAGASMRSWSKLLKTAAEEYPADAMYIFGHANPEYGVTGKKEDLGVMSDFLAATIEYVEKGVEQGKSKEEITDKEVLEGFEDFLYADFWTLADSLGVAYEEVTQS